jgi:uncharacterized repeat protein (TIGR01451 family)
VTFTVEVNPGLLSGAIILLTGYAADNAITMPVVGQDLTVRVQTDLSLLVSKQDRPDPVVPGGTVTYTITASNQGDDEVNNLVIRELFDPDFTVVSSVPPADPGTTDRWTIPLLVEGAVKRIFIEMSVNPLAVPGTIQHNFVHAEDDEGHFVNATEDTIISAPTILQATLDDFPDPAEPGDPIVYAFTYSNLSLNDLTGVTVHAVYDPQMQFIEAFPPPDDPNNPSTWTIGTLAASSAGRIFLTLAPLGAPDAQEGIQPQLRMWIFDDFGASASAIETTAFTKLRAPYVVTLTGVPKNPSVSINPAISYAIRVRNITPDTQTNVTVRFTLPQDVVFLNSLPSPTSEEGNTLTWVYPTLAAGASQQILVRAALDTTAEPGALLESFVSVTDDALNFVQESFTGHVRGTKTDLPPLTLTATAVRRTFPGSQVRFTYRVKNTGVPLAEDVEMTATIPEGTTFVLSTPPPSRRQGTLLTYRLGDLIRSSQSVIRLSVDVDEETLPGTILTSLVEVKDTGGDEASAQVDVEVVEK